MKLQRNILYLARDTNFPQRTFPQQLAKAETEKKSKSTFLTFSFDTRTHFLVPCFILGRINREKYAILSFPFFEPFFDLIGGGTFT